MSEVILVSAVRNNGMYNKCIRDNKYTEGCRKVVFDNNAENLSISVRYNSFLNSLKTGDDCWIVLCHEDWMPLCPMADRFDKLDRQYLYGPIGVLFESKKNIDFLRIRGSVIQAKKDGSSSIKITGDKTEGPVDTFDCQCLVFHSSLLAGKDLRFDENLLFDMYVEDFCAQAKERFGIESRTIDLPCKHFSYGFTLGSFVKSLKYVKAKYRTCPHRYPTIVGHRNSFGGDQTRPVVKYHKHTFTRLVYMLSK